MADLAIAHLWLAQLRLQAELYARPPARRDQKPAHRRSAQLLDRLYFDLVNIVQPDLFVEAGAADATTSLRVAREIDGCTAVAFEANPENHRHFSGLHDYEGAGVLYLNLAATDSLGPITFNILIADGSPISGNSSTLGRSYAREGYPVRSVTVEGVRLDDHTPDADHVAMWVDVEGAADRALRGAPRLLAACDVLKVEVEEKAFWEGQGLSVDVIEVALEAGMVPVARDIEFASHQYNIVFASPYLLRQTTVVPLVETFLADIQIAEASALLTRAREHPLYGKASKAIRRAATPG